MTTGHEEEFRRLFREEAETRLAALAEQALELEGLDGPAPRALIDEMFRNAHTVKGGAAVVGLGTVADVLHELEDLISAMREGRRPAGRAEADRILRAVDAIRALVEAAMEGGDEAAAAAAARAVLTEDAAPEPEPEPASPAPAPAPAQGTDVVPAAPALDAPPPPPRGERRGIDRDSIAVPVQRLDELIRLVGEGAAAQLRVGQLLAERVGGEPAALDEYRELTRVLHELQDKAMRARMVSMTTIATPLRRAVRDIARSTGKQVRWELAGGDTELDRHVLETLREPLVALVRNAVDHGLEPPDEREAAGKEPAGSVRLHAMQIGSDVVVTVTDDGRGIDVDAVREAVGTRRMDEAEALDAIFTPGISTARVVSDISGRGVGLDAVRAAVDRLRGRVEVTSLPGRGTEFRISVPMTLAILRCLIVRCGGRPYALPMHATIAVLASAGRDLSAEGRPAVWVGGEAVGLSELAHVLDVAPEGTGGPVVVLSTPVGRHAFRADALHGQREVVVKELPHLLARNDLLAGASVEPDGSVMLVLDPGGLIATAERLDPGAGAEAPGPSERRAHLLVVDDALTIRELQRSILERAGYEVVTAADGVEALAHLDEAEEIPDLVLTDIEMPGMDGFELTERIRASSEYGEVPVLVLTSRASEEDRRRGMDAGADGYLVKAAFDEHTLLTAVRRLLGEGR